MGLGFRLEGGAGFAGSLRYSSGWAACQNSPSAPKRQPPPPSQPALLSAFHGDPKNVHVQPSLRKKWVSTVNRKKAQKRKYARASSAANSGYEEAPAPQ